MSTAETMAGGWTYERYFELDDGQRYEVIGGELLLTPAPSPRHQKISNRLEHRLTTFVMERSAGQVYDAPIDVVLGVGEEDVVQPDILFIRNEHLSIVGSHAVRGAPDLVVEILSPSSLKRDRLQKAELYARAGVPEYWIVDPVNRTIEVLALQGGVYEIFSEAADGGAAASRVLPGFAVALVDVMEE